MPNRVIKESIKKSPTIDQLSWFEEVVFYRIIVTADDYGRLDGRITVLKNELFPTKESITKKNIEDALGKLVSIGLVCRYIANDIPYLYLPTWESHQQIRAKRSKFPEPDSVCNQMISDDIKCTRNPIQSESNIYAPASAAPIKKTGFKKPTVEELAAYCHERKNDLDAQLIFDHYEANNWYRGKTKISNWKAAVRTWEKNNLRRQPERNQAFLNYQNIKDMVGDD